MTQQLRDDIKTIIEVLTWIFLVLSISLIVENNAIWAYLSFSVWLIFQAYNLYERIQYKLGKRPDMIEIPTQNDQFSKMMLLSIGVLILILSVTYFFTKNLKPTYAVIGLIIGLIIIVSGYLFSPRGWIKIKNDALYIFNEREILNLAQLKEVVLKNDTITFVDILGVNRNSTLLRLDNSAATKIKTFLQDRLQNDHISIIDCVTETAQPRKV